MAAWPSAPTLPQFVEEGGFSEIPQTNAVESEMDVGPAKTRRRFTRSTRKFQCQMRMTSAQVTSFETFWETTLVGGIDVFTWVHPRTRSAANVRFRNPRYQISTQGGGAVNIVSFILEVM